MDKNGNKQHQKTATENVCVKLYEKKVHNGKQQSKRRL